MKKVVELGDGIFVNVENNGYEIVSKRAKIKMAKSGEVVSYENIMSKEIECYLKGYEKIDTEEQMGIYKNIWIKDLVSEKESRDFLGCLGQAVNQINYDFFVKRVSESKTFYKEKEKAEELLPGYSCGFATMSEFVLWIAYQVSKEKWDPKYALKKFKEMMLGELVVLRKED